VEFERHPPDEVVVQKQPRVHEAVERRLDQVVAVASSAVGRVGVEGHGDGRLDRRAAPAHELERNPPPVLAAFLGEPRATRVEIVQFAWHRGEVVAA
jgi:hypothetical protein